MVFDYKVITAASSSDLARYVNDAMGELTDQPWQPIGGVAVSTLPGAPGPMTFSSAVVYAQAMVRRGLDV